MKITETRKMTASSLRNLCIEKDWYSRGDNAEYSVLLTNAEECEMTTTQLAIMAEDIIEHSNPKRFEDCEANGIKPIEYVMFELASICFTTFKAEE